MARKSWRNYLWIVTCLYFLLGLYNIAFAWLGLIFFLAPLVIALIKGDKLYCNKYCDRGVFFRFLGGKLKMARGAPMPAWMKSRWFRYLFVVYFMAMFVSIIISTCLVAFQSQSPDTAVKLFQVLRLPVDWAYPVGSFPAWAVQFAFGFYSLMLTSLVLGFITMLFFKPRSWCVYCPMGTMTQAICRVKQKN